MSSVEQRNKKLAADTCINNSINKPLQRWALCVSYDGSNYHGWQSQKSPKVITVQEHVEKALSVVADEPIKVFCAGRTDAGVHASAQIVHFETKANRAIKAWEKGVNAHLPNTIAIQWAALVSSNFHARFSALSRTYRYVIYNSTARPGMLASQVTWVREPLNVEAMHEAAQFLLGERDFSSFRASGCQSSTPMRFVSKVTVQKINQLIVVEITANAFLLHMVRNIVGSLLDVGKGYKDKEYIDYLMGKKDRTCASATAPPNGLYLVNVEYPETDPLPKKLAGPFWLG